VSETLQPVGPYVVLEEVNKKVDMIGDIVVPDIVQEQTVKFKVTGLGTGLEDFEFPVKVGDIVLASRTGSTLTKQGDKEVLQVKTGNLIARFANEDDTVPMEMFEPHVLIYPISPPTKLVGGIIVNATITDTPRYKVYTAYKGSSLKQGDLIITLNTTISEIGNQSVYTTLEEDVMCVLEEQEV